ncbi:MAG: sulfatase-like hydrolase/transferase [Planctomycetia bacterium]
MRWRARRLPLLALPLLALTLLASACGDRGTPQPQARTTTPGAASKRPPNILLIVIDTLRRDAVEPAAEDGGDMPLLARRARAAAWLPQASSASSWTLPSMASLLTGLPPQEHQLHEAPDVVRGYGQLATLPTLLARARGYRSAAFLGGVGAPLARVLGQGFDEVVDGFQLQRGPEQLREWLARGDGQRPWLALLHTYEAHDPYGAANHPSTPVEGTQADLEALLALHPERDAEELVLRSMLQAGPRQLLRTLPRLAPHAEAVTRTMWSGGRDPRLCAELQAAYRAGVRWVDAQLERTLAWLEAGGHLANTLWIVTGDHGEAFGERGMLGHGRRLDDELLRVPLVLGGVPPFDRPLEWEASVGLTDLLPTLLERVGAPVPSGLDGASFLGTLGTPHRGRPVLSEVRRGALHTAGLSEAECVAVRGPAWKWVVTWERTTGTLEEHAYDLRSDPDERVDLAARAGLAALPLDRATCDAIARARARLWARAGADLAAAAGRPGEVQAGEGLLGTLPCESAR